MTVPSPWERRARQPKGDAAPHGIFYAVGMALSLWETIEDEICVSYTGLIYNDDYRDDDKYFSTPSFENRHKMLSKAILKNMHGQDISGFQQFIDIVLKYNSRRHDIAHGRVVNLGEYGFYLCPNNVLTRNSPQLIAEYQYTTSDLAYYCGEFLKLVNEAKSFAERLHHRRTN
ncbi:hypothetical+protein [Methylocapsa aurea]|uniref:hypothetical protein n=1 Tax=Methylocapsa aurea TaxID=663610 RepID=UPI003D18A2A5